MRYYFVQMPNKGSFLYSFVWIWDLYMFVYKFSAKMIFFHHVIITK